MLKSYKRKLTPLEKDCHFLPNKDFFMVKKECFMKSLLTSNNKQKEKKKDLPFTLDLPCSRHCGITGIYREFFPTELLPQFNKLTFISPQNKLNFKRLRNFLMVTR